MIRSIGLEPSDSDPAADRDLFREIVLDHSQTPRNFGVLVAADLQGETRNPLCSDRFVFGLQVQNRRVVNARFQGVGCTIAMASASILAEAIPGSTYDEIEIWCACVAHDERNSGQSCARLTEQIDVPEEVRALAWIAGIRKRTCAALPWRLLRNILGNTD